MASVYAFEYCDCIYESAFGAISVHSTKAGAYRAMRAWLLFQAAGERDMQQHGYPDYRIRYSDHRVRTIEVKED